MIEIILPETPNPSRRRVTYAQLEQLWEFLNRNRHIATGFNKTAQARAFLKNMWEEISVTLNSHGDGAVKDWKGWCKYWNDYKFKLKKMQRVSQQRTGGGPSQIRHMTDIEKKILMLLEEDLPSARVEPFEEVAEVGRSNNTVTLSITHEDSSEVSESILLIEPVPAPSRRPGTPPPTAPGPESAAQVKQTPRGPSTARAPRPPRTVPSPRRRRVRPEPPMSQQAARHLLVQIANRRAETEERKCTLLEQMVQELREIKEVLRSRNDELPTTEELSDS